MISVLKRNITPDDHEIYKELYFSSKVITVEFNKDKISKSVFEVAINVYYKGQCKSNCS